MGEPIELMLEHLDSFGLNWRDGKNFHIDHIIPKCAFAKYGITDPKIINARENLQIITAKENLRKAAKYNIYEAESYFLMMNIEFISQM